MDSITCVIIGTLVTGCHAPAARPSPAEALAVLTASIPPFVYVDSGEPALGPQAFILPDASFPSQLPFERALEPAWPSPPVFGALPGFYQTRWDAVAHSSWRGAPTRRPATRRDPDRTVRQPVQHRDPAPRPASGGVIARRPPIGAARARPRR